MIKSLKIKNKRFFQIFSIILIFFGLIGVLFISLYSLENDPNDELLIQSPSADGFIRDVVPISFIASDNQQQQINTNVFILDNSCEVNLGSIANTQVASSSSTQTIYWDSTKSFADGKTNLQDGNYCLSICGDYLSAAGSYEACSLRRFTLRNQGNRAPSFVTSPTNTTITQGGDFRYSARASDPESDPITYSLSQRPAFLQILNGTLFADNISSLGRFPVTITATDPFGLATEQSFVLVVNAPPEPEPEPTPTPDLTPDPDEDPSPDEPAPLPVEDYDLDIISPNSDSVFLGRRNVIEWSFNSAQGLENLVLEYAEAGTEEWQPLTTIPTDRLESQREVNWDVREIPVGEYEILITTNFLNAEAVAQETISDVFEITTEEEDNETIEDLVTITELEPANSSAVESASQISAKITTSDFGEISIEQLLLTLNGENITDNCELTALNDELTEYNLTCELSESLPVNEYDVEISIDFGNDQQISKQWQFSVISPQDDASDDDDQSSEGNITIFGITIATQLFNILVLLLVLVLCLLLLPLVLFTIWRRRSKRYSYTSTSTKTKTTNSKNENQGLVGGKPIIGGMIDPFAGDGASNKTKSQPFKPVSENTSKKQNTDSKSEKSKNSEDGILSKATDWLKNRKDNLTKKTTQTEKKVEKTTAATAASAPTKTIETSKNQSTESILTNSNTPVAPIAAAGTAAAATSAMTNNNNESTKQDEDLPAWLKEEEDSAQAAVETTTETKTTTTTEMDSDEEDPADPYGFGEYSLGDD